MTKQDDFSNDPEEFERNIYYIVAGIVKGPAWGAESDTEITATPEERQKTAIHRLTKVLSFVIRELKEKEIISADEIKAMLRECSA